jgi:hypothetical protein
MLCYGLAILIKMTIGEELQKLTEFAKDYRKESQNSLERNRHMNEIEEGEQVQQRIIDAVLTDFINYVGVRHCCDYGLYTSYLKR